MPTIFSFSNGINLDFPRIFTNMENRDTTPIANNINSYCCGFPCKPSLACQLEYICWSLNCLLLLCFLCSVHSFCAHFLSHIKIRFSMLHNQSRFLQEQAARPFFLSLAEIARRRPLVVLLENVLGLLRVWEQVEAALLRLRSYGYRFGKVSCQLQQFLAFPLSLGCFKNKRKMLKALYIY